MENQSREQFDACLVPVSAAPASAAVRVALAIDRFAPLRSAFIVIYCTIAILLLALPGPVADWLNDLPPNASVEICKSAVDAIEKVSEKIGLMQLYQDARGSFVKPIHPGH
jgi:hypothetical protein